MKRCDISLIRQTMTNMRRFDFYKQQKNKPKNTSYLWQEKNTLKTWMPTSWATLTVR